MAEQILVHKPKGVELSSNIRARLLKEFSGIKTSYIYKKDGDIWRYESGKDSKDCQFLFDKDLCTAFRLDKQMYHYTKENYVFYRDKSDVHESWFLSIGIGLFSQFTGIANKASELVFENFAKHLDLTSLQSFTKNLCSLDKSLSYVLVSGNNGVQRYGKWNECEGAFFSENDFIYKVDYQAKTAVKYILAFLTQPDKFKEEFQRLEKLSDFEIRQEAEKIQGLSQVFTQFP